MTDDKKKGCSFILALVFATTACGRAIPPDEVAIDGDAGAITETDGSDARTKTGDDARLGSCPSGLPGPTLVLAPDASFCVDSTEVTYAAYAAFLATSPRADAHPRCTWKTSITDVTGDANKPVAGVDWCDATAYCAWASKRLCRDNEWGAACSFDGRQLFPYGSAYDVSRCNVSSSASEPVASRQTCEGSYSGVFDMVGNVAEWLGDNSCQWVEGSGVDDLCMRRGGDYASGSAATCGVNVVGVSRASRDPRIGFRCCED